MGEELLLSILTDNVGMFMHYSRQQSTLIIILIQTGESPHIFIGVESLGRNMVLRGRNINKKTNNIIFKKCVRFNEKDDITLKILLIFHTYFEC